MPINCETTSKDCSDLSRLENGLSRTEYFRKTSNADSKSIDTERQSTSRHRDDDSYHQPGFSREGSMRSHRFFCDGDEGRLPSYESNPDPSLRSPTDSVFGAAEDHRLLLGQMSNAVSWKEPSAYPSYRFSRSLSKRSRHGPIRKLRRRVVFKNGECNVLQRRMSKRHLRFLQDIFTTLVDTQWRWTLLVFALSFFLSWLAFAIVWWLIAFTHGDFEPGHDEESGWTPCVVNLFNFASCFLFSVETQHTIGYGSRSTTEECPEAIFVMCLQSITGVMIQAFMVGIVFAKMSRPKQRTQTLLFSRNAVICQRDGEMCLMFRVGDMRKSHIIGANVRAQLIKPKTTKEGEYIPQHQYELELGTDGNDGNLFFIWPMTVIHRITEESPLFGISAMDLVDKENKWEIVVILEGTIESTGQTTQARSSYLTSEILWGHRFKPMVEYNKERQCYEVDYGKFDNTCLVDTPLCSARELAEFIKIKDDLPQSSGIQHAALRRVTSEPHTMQNVIRSPFFERRGAFVNI